MPLFSDFLGGLALPPAGRNRRVSSNEQPNWNDGNFDMTRLQPGETLEIPVLEGPGVITHLWMTSHAGGVGELDALSLRIYWDGREAPAVEAPLGMFFAVGQGRPAAVESVPVQVSSSGSLSCYWRMPFARSARITVTNDNPDRWTGLYWQVDWTQLDALPPETGTFHARYRQEHPAAMGRDYLIADLEGQGQYVGTVLAVTMAQDGWFGEGDDFFFIDGEDVPSLQGTGSEDYFNDAWGFRARTGPWFGQPRWEGYQAGDSGVCYRWHVLDPVGFARSLRLTLEHKGNRPASEDAWYLERPDYLSSVAFWYQTGEPKPFGALPTWPERCVPWQEQHLLRAFRRARATEGEVAITTEGFFGGRPALAWRSAPPGARLVLPFQVTEAGRHALRLVAFSGPSSAVFEVELDDEPLRALDCRAAEVGEANLLLGSRELTAGEHRLVLEADPLAAAACDLVLERLRLLRLPPEATRPVKTHNEAHFIRLGIGRALYAYRLAYDELPETLERLVETGIMPERFLTDENGASLAARREGDWFVVEVAGWVHRWQGLDARR